MDTEIDWQRELDSSFGTGEDMPVAHYAAAGRTALRRRRRLVAAVGTGAAALAVGVVWSVAPGSAPRSDAPIANDRSAGPERTTDATPDATATKRRARVRFLEQMRSRSWAKGEAPARSFPGGLQVREGAVVHERRDDLYPGKDTESAALDLSYGGTRWWVLLEWDDGGSTMSSEKASDGWHASFDAFVSASTAGGGMTHGPTTEANEQDEDFPYAGLVDYRDGVMTPAVPGVEILDQRADPDLPSYLDPTTTGSGLALVEWEGERWFVLVVELTGPDSVTTFAADKAGADTIDEFIEFAEARADEGGLR